jgi:hypothetical protein
MQAEYDLFKQRWNDGVATDDERRIAKEYERDGFIESRLLREQEAKRVARLEYAQSVAPDDEDEDGPGDGRLTARSKVALWRDFATKVNAELGDDAPIKDVQAATRRELVAAYSGYALQATQDA